MKHFSLDQLVRRLRSREEGVTALEYALIAALIAVVIIAAVRTVGQNACTTFTTVGTEMGKANSAN
jgi:pilus assembly protein Flp/PilA